VKKYTLFGIIMFVLLFIGLGALFYHVAVTDSDVEPYDGDDDRRDPLDPTNPEFPHPPFMSIWGVNNAS